MENATDALYIAAAVLMLLIALAGSMGAFARIRTQFDDIIELDTSIDLAKDDEGSYIYYMTNKDKTDVRTVGVETVISSMYRVVKENYNVYIKLNDSLTGVTTPAQYEQKYTNSEEVINTIIDEGDNIIEISIAGGINSITDITNLLGEGGLYNELAGQTFTEYLGVYQLRADEVSSENRPTYRVITYVEN